MLFQIKQNSVAKNDEGGLDDWSFQNEEPFDERLFEALGLKVHKVWQNWILECPFCWF